MFVLSPNFLIITGVWLAIAALLFLRMRSLPKYRKEDYLRSSPLNELPPTPWYYYIPYPSNLVAIVFAIAFLVGLRYAVQHQSVYQAYNGAALTLLLRMKGAACKLIIRRPL